jgi:preprotein translocase subunit SecE
MANDDNPEKKPPSDAPVAEEHEHEHGLMADDLRSMGHAQEEGTLVDNPTDLMGTDEHFDGDVDQMAMAPNQLGTMRFVYAAYFAGAIAIAFLLSKAVGGAWQRLALWKPQFGEPHDEIVIPVSAILGAGTAFYYWKKRETRQYAEEVASELSKVTWPTRTEVTNSTTVVIITTMIATIFFALMDRFWGFLTNLVYGT